MNYTLIPNRDSERIQTVEITGSILGKVLLDYTRNEKGHPIGNTMQWYIMGSGRAEVFSTPEKAAESMVKSWQENKYKLSIG